MAKITLKAARVNAGFTQKEIARLMGKSESTILNWEKGKGKNINWYDFQKLCTFLKVNPDDIFFKD